MDSCKYNTCATGPGFRKSDETRFLPSDSTSIYMIRRGLIPSSELPGGQSGKRVPACRHGVKYRRQQPNGIKIDPAIENLGASNDLDIKI